MYSTCRYGRFNLASGHPLLSTTFGRDYVGNSKSSKVWTVEAVGPNHKLALVVLSDSDIAERLVGIVAVVNASQKSSQHQQRHLYAAYICLRRLTLYGHKESLIYSSGQEPWGPVSELLLLFESQ